MVTGVAVAFLYALGFGKQVQEDPSTDRLIAQLDGLHESASREEFLNRPAMLELLALADRAMPALSRALASSSWSIRASALYVIASHGDENAAQMAFRNFLRDPHPAVRAVAAMATGPHLAAELLPDGKEEISFANRWDLRAGGHSLDWLPDAFYIRRIQRYLDVLGSEDPIGNSTGLVEESESSIKSSVSSAVWAVEFELAGERGHLVGDGLLQLLFRIPAQEERILSMALEAAAMLPRHRDSTHKDGAVCPQMASYSDTLCSVIESRVWGSSNELVLDRGMSLLSALSHADNSRVSALIAKFASEHPDATVRDRAQRIMEGRELPRPARGDPDSRKSFAPAEAGTPRIAGKLSPSASHLKANTASGTVREQEGGQPKSSGRWLAIFAVLSALSMCWWLWRLRKSRLPCP